MVELDLLNQKVFLSVPFMYCNSAIAEQKLNYCLLLMMVSYASVQESVSFISWCSCVK